MNNEIGKNIYKLRKQSNLTQQQLSKIIGVSIASISKWETGAAYPDIELLPKIATIFDVSIDYIFDYHLHLYDDSKKILEKSKQVFETGQHSKAISMLSEALLRYPNDMLIKFNRAQMMIYSATKPPLDLEKSNVLLEAISELKEVIKYTESREIIEESYYLISMSYTNLKDFDKSIHSLKLAVEYANSFDNLQTDNDLPQFHRLNASDTAWSAILNQRLRLLNLIESRINEEYKEMNSMSDFIDIITALKNSLL